MCQDGPCTSWKTTCVSASASSQSLYPYTCTCNTGQGFIQVGKISGLENQELCVLSSAQLEQSSPNVTCSCGPNTHCKYVEGSKACECLQGFVGDASSSSSGCVELTPSDVFVLHCKMQIPLLASSALAQIIDRALPDSESGAGAHRSHSPDGLRIRPQSIAPTLPTSLSAVSLVLNFNNEVLRLLTD